MIDAIVAFFRALFGTRRRTATTGGAGAAILASTVAFVSPWEGLVPVAYLDRIASPRSGRCVMVKRAASNRATPTRPRNARPC
jgi:hypothetical protein